MKIRTMNNLILLIWTAAIVFLLLLVITKPWSPELRTITCLVVFGGVLLTWFLAALIFQKAVRKISALLFDQCDTDRFLSTIQDNAPRVAPGKSPGYLWVMLAYEGLYASGRYGEALAELYRLTRFKNTRTGASHQAAWMINVAEVCIALGQTDDAQRALTDCRSILENREMPQKAQQILNEAYRYETCKLNIALGASEGAEEALTAHFNQAKNEYTRVGVKFHFALLYRLTGEDETAREALEYVVSHGNRLHFAALAREQLGMEPLPSVARLWKQGAANIPV